MKTAHLIFTATAELNLDSDTFPKGMTDQEKMDFWISGAREEPLLALYGINDVKWIVTGEVKKDA